MKLLVKIAALILSIGMLSACKNTQAVVTVDYEGQGKITEGSKINCGTSCQGTYSIAATESVTINYSIHLKATPAAGHEFYGWATCGKSTTCDVLIEPHCAEYNVGQNFITCKRYEPVEKSEHAIFVPAGSVVASSWYGQSSCLVTVDNELKCWNTGFEPADLPAVSNPTAVSITYKAGCVLDDNGLQCWGKAASQMPVLTAPTAMAIDFDYACVIDAGQVKCWGYPGQTNAVVDAIPPLSHPVAIWVAPTLYGNVCVQDDNGIHCWGSAVKGQSRPPLLNDPVAISAGDSTSCALTADGVRCWGDKSDVTALNALVNNASRISDPSLYGICAVDSAGAHCITRNNVVIPMDPAFQTATDVAVGGKSMCVLNDAGSLCAWIDQSAPTPYVFSSKPEDKLLTVGDPTKCIMSPADNLLNCSGTHDEAWISAYKNFKVPVSHANVLSVMPRGSLWCVGADSGLYCKRDANDRLFQSVNLIAPPTGLTGVVDLDIKDFVACAVHANGVTCWGENTWGQLDVPPLSHPLQVAVGRYHACALDDSGVVCWGETAAPPAN